MAFKELVVVLALCAFAVDAFSWKNCDPNAPVKVKTLSVKPTPIEIKEGSQITLSGSAEITGNAGLNYRVELSIKRKLAGWLPVWIPLPCVSDIGSCTYDGITCAKIWNVAGKPGTCPLPLGTQSLPALTVTIPKVNIPSSFTSGHYWLQGKVIDTDNDRDISCVEIEVDVA